MCKSSAQDSSLVSERARVQANTVSAFPNVNAMHGLIGGGLEGCQTVSSQHVSSVPLHSVRPCTLVTGVVQKLLKHGADAVLPILTTLVECMDGIWQHESQRP
jgi:hypothetical protein